MEIIMNEIILYILAVFGIIYLGEFVSDCLINKFFYTVRLKLALFLIGKIPMMANCVILSGHIVPKGNNAFFKNNSFNQGVMISGAAIEDVLENCKRD